MNEINTDYGLFINDFSLTDISVLADKPLAKTYYRLYLVTYGEGELISPHITYKIKKGYVFMTLPYETSIVKSINQLKYISIEFAGARGVTLAKGLLDYVHSPVFENYNHLIDLWENTLKLSKVGNKTLLAEGLLLYTLGSIPGKGILKKDFKKRESIMLQTYIRNNFNNPDLSLESVAKTFGYNKKYLSDKFKKNFDIGFTEFLRDVRLSNAISLMELGTRSISRVSTLSGFRDSLYFSKLFKAKYGIPPKEYISLLRTKEA